MENTFSSNSVGTIQKEIEVRENSHQKQIDNIDYYFEIENIYQWITKNDFKRVIFLTQVYERINIYLI